MPAISSLSLSVIYAEYAVLSPLLFVFDPFVVTIFAGCYYIFITGFISFDWLDYAVILINNYY